MFLFLVCVLHQKIFACTCVHRGWVLFFKCVCYLMFASTYVRLLLSQLFFQSLSINWCLYVCTCLRFGLFFSRSATVASVRLVRVLCFSGGSTTRCFLLVVCVYFWMNFFLVLVYNLMFAFTYVHVLLCSSCVSRTKKWLLYLCPSTS